MLRILLVLALCSFDGASAAYTGTNEGGGTELNLLNEQKTHGDFFGGYRAVGPIPDDTYRI